MDKNEAKIVMERSLSALPVKDLKRIRSHIELKTPICAGSKAPLYTDGKGGA